MLKNVISWMYRHLKKRIEKNNFGRRENGKVYESNRDLKKWIGLDKEVVKTEERKNHEKKI